MNIFVTHVGFSIKIYQDLLTILLERVYFRVH